MLRELSLAKIIVDHLRSLGMEVETRIAHTGVVAVLKGGLPCEIVALRAEFDALLVMEISQLPFASKVKSICAGQNVGVMYAFRHDTHIAILMGVD